MIALRLLLIAAAFCTLVERPAYASEPLPEGSQPAAPADGPPTRSLWLAPTYQALLDGAFEPSSRHGVGVRAAYEFHVAPTFNVGLALAYRVFPGATATSQLNYGAMLKHFFSAAWATEDGVYPYVDYGLLLQQTFIEGRSGSAVSHDTRLGGGAVVRHGSAALYAGLAGHYTRLTYFDVASRWVPFVEVELGWAHPF